METTSAFAQRCSGEDVKLNLYRSLIGSLSPSDLDAVKSHIAASEWSSVFSLILCCLQTWKVRRLSECFKGIINQNLEAIFSGKWCSKFWRIGIFHIIVTQPIYKNSDTFKDKMMLMDLAQNEDNIFQADECDAFDSDVDDEPTAQSIFMANLSSDGQQFYNASHLVHNYYLRNVISYEQYLTTNDVSVVPSCASVYSNNAYVSD
ncbi:hypothetical protein Tco_1165361 [Tanacetum coccineum]